MPSDRSRIARSAGPTSAPHPALSPEGRGFDLLGGWPRDPPSRSGSAGPAPWRAARPGGPTRSRRRRLPARGTRVRPTTARRNVRSFIAPAENRETGTNRQALLCFRTGGEGCLPRPATTPSSSAPASPACTSSTGCASSGLRVRVFEAGDGVGGTWYWNRYPGARFDSESWTYGYSFSDEILREWEWSEHFAAQPETLRYCNFVADKLDLRRDIEFDCRIAAPRSTTRPPDEWEIESEDGRRARARFLITAIGPLSAPTMPTIPGVGDLPRRGLPHRPVAARAGELRRQAGRGDRHRRDRACRRSPRSPRRSATSPCSSARRTGARRCTTAGSTRPPRPASRRPTPRSSRAAAIPSAASSTQADPRKALEVSPEEREAFYEKLYREPGFGIWMGNFRDVLIDAEANATITEFMRRKIRARVKDPAVAEKLIPTNHGFGTRRVPLESGYYEVYNQPNVQPRGPPRDADRARSRPPASRPADAEHEFDMIIYATGFDAITGAFDRIDVRGRGRPAAAGQVGGGPAHLPRPADRGLPQPVHAGRAAQRGHLLQHPALHRAERRLGDRAHRATCASGATPAWSRPRRPSATGPSTCTRPGSACCSPRSTPG